MRYVLGSRSPRRLELLRLLVGDRPVIALPPRNSDEAGFDGLTTRSAIEQRLHEIVSAKASDVLQQIHERHEPAPWTLICADTTIVLQDALSHDWMTLGQPPSDPSWPAVVAEWFERYYADREHEVWTSVRILTDRGIVQQSVTRTTVRFRRPTADELDWYLASGESLGKAGGYAIQGLASIFVERIEGSLTNIVGLPLEALRRDLPMS